MQAIDGRFGTVRGLVRAGLAFGQAAFVPRADLAGIERLVFVCHGNVCRSAFADALAARLGWPTASFGLSTSCGRPAHPPVERAAAERGIDLADHRSTALAAFAPRAGDLYLVMEVRQIARLRADPRFRDARVDLLGRYGGMPHLHDPYSLSEAFTRSSLADIDRSVRGLISALRRAGSCPPSTPDRAAPAPDRPTARHSAGPAD